MTDKWQPKEKEKDTHISHLATAHKKQGLAKLCERDANRLFEKNHFLLIPYTTVIQHSLRAYAQVVQLTVVCESTRNQ